MAWTQVGSFADGFVLGPGLTVVVSSSRPTGNLSGTGIITLVKP